MKFVLLALTAFFAAELEAQSFPAPFDRGATYSTVRHISPAGDDSSGNGSTGAPYRTLTRALQGAAPGLRVVMLPGTYPEQGHFSNLQGTAAQPIAIIGQGNVVIDATGGTAGLSLSDPRYLVIENLTVERSPVHGMNIDDGGSYASPGRFVVIRNVRFRQIGSGGNNDCLKLSGINDFYIEQSEFSGCNIGEAIDMVGCHDGIITGNYFHDMPGTAVQAKGGSARVLIHGNRFRNISTHSVNLGGSTGDPFIRPIDAPYEGERIQAIGNLVETSRAASFAFLGCNECVVAHNTIALPERWLVRILEGSRDSSVVRSRNGYVLNNIFYYRRSSLSVTVNVGPNTDPGTFTFGNNLYYATDGSAFNGQHGSGIPAETNSLLQVDPLLSNVAAGDLHVALTSPVGGAGRALPFGSQFHMEQIAPGSPPDIGAYRVAPTADTVPPGAPTQLRLIP